MDSPEEVPWSTSIDALRGAVDNWIGALDEIDTEAIGNPTELATVERARFIAEMVKLQVDSASPYLLGSDTADPLRTKVEQQANWATSATSQDFNNMAAHLGGVTSALVSAGLSTSPEDRHSAEAVAEVRRAASAEVTNLRQEVQALSGELTKIQADAEVAENQISTQIQEVRDGLTQTKAEIDTQLEAVRTQQAQWDSAYKQDTETRKERFETEVVAFADQKVGEAVEAAVEAAEAQLAERLSAADEQVERLQKRSDEAAQVLDAVARNGIAGQYLEVSKDEKESADRWRMATVGAIAMAFVLLLAGLFDDGFTSFSIDNLGSWDQALTKFVLAIPAAVLATYTGAQSHRHRQNHEYAREVASRLVTLDPFLTLVDEDSGKQLKNQFGALFKPPPLPAHADDTPRVGFFRRRPKPSG